MKKWLEDNEVYFRIFATLLLSFMSIVLSLSQLGEMKKQNNLQEQQLKPNFYAFKKSIYSETDFFHSENMVIINQGFQSKIVDISQIALMDITFGLQMGTNAGNLKKETFVFFDYFTNDFKLGDNTADFVFFGSHNLKKYNSLELGLNRLANKKGCFAHLEMIIIVRIEYIDPSQGKKYIFFKLKKNQDDGQLLTEKEGLSFFSDIENRKLESYNKIQASDLLF